MAYADDVLVAGDQDWVRGVFNTFTKLWECRVDGILGEKDQSGKEIGALNFLGMTIDKGVESGFHVHQFPYITTKLADHAG